MIDELEFWGVDSSSGAANADALRQAASERLPSDEVLEMHASEVGPLPEIVRDVQADDIRDLRRWLAHCVNELGGAVHIKHGGHLPLAIEHSDRGVVLRVES